MAPLRFCMITTFYPPYSFGGDGVFVHRLSNLLARGGHQVDIIHCVDSYRALNRGMPASSYQDEAGVTVHGLESGFGALSPLTTHQTGHPFFKARKIRAILAQKCFDVIHFHNISLIGGPAILRYGEGVKLYTLHDHWLVCPTHVLFKFNRKACTRPSCLACTLWHRRPPQLWRYSGMLRDALRHVDAFIAPSEFTLRRHLAEGLDIPIIHIPHGLTARSAEENRPADPEDIGLPGRPYFLFVGRLEKLKGLQTVIPLFHRYDKADLVIAGDGSYRSRLEQLAAGCERIHFVRHLASAQLKSFYARAIALLVPSLTYETFGQVVIEAYATRTPVIARDLGPLPEIVGQSGGGLIFRDDPGLLKAMEQLRTDRTLRDTLGKTGYLACSQWTDDLYLGRYIALIDEIRMRKPRQATGSGGTLGSRTA